MFSSLMSHILKKKTKAGIVKKFHYIQIISVQYHLLYQIIYQTSLGTLSLLIYFSLLYFYNPCMLFVSLETWEHALFAYGCFSLVLGHF